MFLIVLSMFYAGSAAVAEDDDIPGNIPSEATQYAEENYMTFYEVSVEDKNMGLELSGKHVKLGYPCVIYHIKSEQNQPPVFYFPVLEGDKCILVMEIAYVGDVWTGNISKIYSYELNKIDCTKPYIAYQYGECVYFENQMKKVKLGDCQELKKFSKLPFQKKVSIIQNNTKNYESMTQNCLSGEENIVGYTPKLKYNTLENVECEASKFYKSQGNKPYCWAACVATTYNYFKGKQVSTLDVVNKMNAKKKDMGTSDVLKAFQKYGFRFRNVYHDVPSLSNIRASLRNSYLLTAVLTGKDDDHIYLADHDVIIYATRYKNGKKFIGVHNPQGKGSQSWVEYKNVKTIFWKTRRWKSTYMDSRYIPK